MTMVTDIIEITKGIGASLFLLTSSLNTITILQLL